LFLLKSVFISGKLGIVHAWRHPICENTPFSFDSLGGFLEFFADRLRLCVASVLISIVKIKISLQLTSLPTQFRHAAPIPQGHRRCPQQHRSAQK